MRHLHLWVFAEQAHTESFVSCRVKERGREVCTDIGVEAYDSSAVWNSLKTPRRDALAVAELLRKAYGFKTDLELPGEASFARARGTEAAVAFVEADELPGAIRPSGLYTVTGETVRTKIVLKRDGAKKELRIEGHWANLDAYTETMMEAVAQAAEE